MLPALLQCRVTFHENFAAFLAFKLRGNYVHIGILQIPQIPEVSELCLNLFCCQCVK